MVTHRCDCGETLDIPEGSSHAYRNEPGRHEEQCSNCGAVWSIEPGSGTPPLKKRQAPPIVTLPKEVATALEEVGMSELDEPSAPSGLAPAAKPIRKSRVL